MPSTINFKRGDIVLVPFPFTDLSANKRRPALVISSDGFNARRNDLIVVAITSQIPRELAADEILILPDELRQCGLPKPSLIKVRKIVTLHQQLVLKRMGGLSTRTLSQVLLRVREEFEE